MLILEVKNIVKNFGGVRALQNGNLSCHTGRITGLLGANGSGKSTISKVICGLYPADSGEIIYDGRGIHYKNPLEARKDGISMVFQNLSLIPDLTVWQNIVLGAEEAKGLFLDNGSSIKMAQEIVSTLMPGLDVGRVVGELGPSELQVAEIAKALSQKPRLLILDEPTAALEKAEVDRLFTVMRRLASEGVSMIFTSHRMWEVMEICDEVTVFRNGESIGSFDFEKDGKCEDKIVAMITGENKDDNSSAKIVKPPVEAPPVLEIKGLNLGDILKDIDLTVKKGEILGIGGLAGQGQHELLLAIAGNYSKVKAGNIKVDGADTQLNTPRRAIRNKLLLVPGDRHREGLFLSHSVYTNMIFPKLALKKTPFAIPEKEYESETDEIIRLLSIKTSHQSTIIGTLSGGNQQKVVVGKWLPFDKNVLLLSDPAKGVDVGAKHDLYAFIEKLVEEKQLSVILYASDTEELLEHCNRIAIMYEGKIVETLEGEAMTEENIIAASMQLKGGKTA